MTSLVKRRKESWGEGRGDEVVEVDGLAQFFDLVDDLRRAAVDHDLVGVAVDALFNGHLIGGIGVAADLVVGVGADRPLGAVDGDLFGFLVGLGNGDQASHGDDPVPGFMAVVLERFEVVAALVAPALRGWRGDP